MTEFSSSQEAGQGVAPCDESIIPIFPMRYTLKADKLLDMVQNISSAPTPTSIGSTPNHDILRIRQGFVFILAENHVEGMTDPQKRWQIFRYNTNSEDDNSQTIRSDTEIASHGSNYTFKKYHWTDGTVGGKWELHGNERAYPYAFVSAQVSKVWVAYSEFRWPSWFFTKAENDTAFRDKLMTSADVAAKSGDHVAPLSELANLSPAFVVGEPDPDAVDNLANALRQNAVFQENMNSVARCNNSRTNGLLVALHDPVGEHLDMATSSFLLSETKKNYIAEHQYPMTIGRHVKQVRDHEDANIGFFNWGFEDSVLFPGFERDFARMEHKVRYLDEQERQLIASISRMKERTGFGTVLDLLTLTNEEAENLSGVLKEDVTAFAQNITSRTDHMLGASSAGSGHLMSVIDGSGGNYAKAVQDTLKITKDLLLAQKELHRAFLPAFNAVLTVYGKEWALAATGPAGSAPEVQQITNVMFSRSIGTFSSVGDLSTEFENIMRQEWAGLNNAREIGLQTISGNIETAVFNLSENAGVREIGVDRYYARLEFMAEGDASAGLRRMQNADLAINGVGTLAGFLSLYSTINNYGAPNRNASSVGRAVQNPHVQIIAAFGDAFSSVHGIGTSVATRNMATSRAALQAVFGNSMSLGRAVRISPAAGSWAVRGMRLFVKAAGIIGVAMSAAMMAEGYERQDMKMMIGNGLMLAGGVALLFATGIGAIIAVAVIIVGFLLSLMANSDGEDWVRRSFWGTSDDYWNRVRLGASLRIERAKVLAYPGDPEYAAMREFMDHELAEFVDMFSTLELKNPVRSDGEIEIHCGTIQTPSDVRKIAVEATYDAYFKWESDARLTGPTYVSPGIARLGIAPPANTNASDWGEVWVRVTIPRVPNGRFRESEKYDVAEV